AAEIKARPSGDPSKGQLDALIPALAHVLKRLTLADRLYPSNGHELVGALEALLQTPMFELSDTAHAALAAGPENTVEAYLALQGESRRQSILDPDASQILRFLATTRLPEVVAAVACLPDEVAVPEGLRLPAR